MKRWDKKYGMTYKVLDLLQTVFYRSDATREAFVEMCSDIDVQKLTFDSYLYKTVVPANPLVQLKITAKTVGSLSVAMLWLLPEAGVIRSEIFQNN
jgi:geranylgeranyl reductase